MVPVEEDQVEKFIGGLPDNIQGNVITAEPTRLQDAVRIANNLMDKKLKGYANTGGQNVARAYAAGNNEKKEYEGHLPLCNKCKLHHEGPCTVRCGKCNKIGHMTQDCRVTISTTSTQRGQMVNQKVVTCFECGAQGHFQKDYVSYAVELANERTSETNIVLRGCTLGLLGHPFNIDLVPIDLGSFDIIIGMDWLAQNHAVIVYDKKIVRIPYGNEILIIQGDKCDKEKK
ncbi:putative reverse transcriptase domain-containing protein [Tanacetum coccineum]